MNYVAAEIQTCGPGVGLYGVTIPRGDIYVQYGNLLEIYCSLTRSKDDHHGRKYNSSNLFFSYDNDPVESNYVTIVNETTIKLEMEPPRWKKLMHCSLRLDDGTMPLVCLNYVFVGDKPQPLENFNCVSHNWESLNCSWTRKPNFIPTQYNVSFTLKKTNYKYHFPCPGPTDNNYCLWNASSIPTYRVPYTHYYFLIKGTNVLGEVTQNFTLDHFASVLPSKPVNLSVIESTCESLTITWAVPVALHNFPPGLSHKIMYQSKYDNINSWQTIYPDVSSRSSLVVYNITGLKYAHTLYDIRVMIKPTIADKSKWSAPATTTFHTNATVPGAPPRTAVGGFEIRNPTADSREVYIYWQQIPKYLQNGDNFEYKIVNVIEFTPNGPQVSPVVSTVVTKTYAQYSNLSHNRYQFSIVSSNNIGYSLDYSNLTVPEKEKTLPEPAHFIKSSYDHGIWELNWKLDSSVTSYTIFWCDNKMDRPYECQGFLNWTEVYVGKDIKGETAVINVTLPVDKVYQIALSANSNSLSSSGMVWAYCTLLSGKVSSKLKNMWINNIGPDFMEVNWMFDCLRIHEGFQLHYCPIRDPETPTCKEPEKTIAIKGNAVDSHAAIHGLKPYTTYAVYFVTMQNIPLSKMLLNTTLEAAPDSPPKHIKHSDVTNSSMVLSWDRPTSLNGVLRHYILYWNNNSTKVENQSATVQYKLTSLQGYTDYLIKVQACTTACSANSSVILVKTQTGVPGYVDAPLVRFSDKTEYNMVVTWNAPREPGGDILHYDVHVKLTDGNSILKEKHYESKSLKLEIPTRECQAAGGPKYYIIQVRAVNQDEHGLLYGPWSIPGEGNCVPGLPNLPMMVLLFAVGILALLAICISVVYVIRYVCMRCKAMQNVGVKLPPTLELNNVFKDKSPMDIQMATHVCPPPLKPLDMKIIPPPDQQLLLDKKNKDEGQESSTEDCEESGGDQESSGCGSGHESVSSSITAGTHITDSGTEADERPSTPDVFGETHGRKNGPDLRSRGTSVGTNNTSVGSGGEGYSRVAPAPPTNGGYVTVASASRGYVSHPPLWSKGYVTVGPQINTMNTTCE
ncbi:FN3 [Nesidiocoris tenuis]|nr:FN3 [Nesidiocoris tenuis]